MYKKKLIEVALPLEAINEQSAREKSIRHGHPSTLHLWWARRPLAAARAVIWASLVDDPSSHPELFPTEEEQNAERQRLFGILERLVVWENSNNPDVLKAAKAEIMKSTDNNPPALLDPFAGGGAIPLEAQRLGLEAHAHDLNPVAVMINKAMIEIPPRFSGKPPVNPDNMKMAGSFEGASGLAEDVRYYGEWMKQEAFRRIGHLYPKVKVPAEQGGGEATVIAWIWARTVKCPNPACGCEMPLANSFVLSKKKGKEAYIHPTYNNITGEVSYSVSNKPSKIPEPKVGKGQFRCVFCENTAGKDYIHKVFQSHKDGKQLMAIVAEGKNGRVYLSPDTEQYTAANIPKPEDYPYQEMNQKCTDLVSGRGYGFTSWDQLFTNRQLTALTTFNDLVKEAQDKAEQDAIAAGLPDDHIPLADGGSGALAYGQAVRVYLAFVVDKMSDYHSSICSWHSSKELIRNTFGRQAIPMVWDFVEGNPFCSSAGSYDNMLDWVTKCLIQFPKENNNGIVRQFDAQSDSGLRNIAVSTDPPYYDNIGYADLSDFFYVWLRRSLKDVFPKVFRTMLVPKTDELIATPYRHNGSAKEAKEFFEDGMAKACQQMYLYTRDDIPVTIYYAYKQSDSEDINETKASSGWETMLNAIIQSGFAITGTWPMRTEMANRSVASGTNALASSIVLVCRKRDENAPVCTRRNFVNELKRELKTALKNLQSSNIAPVDMAQSAIGPGIAVFSKYKSVLEADGSPMSVRSALQIINQELDLYFNEQDNDLDPESRFCVELYSQYAFNDVKFGDANTLATAKNISVKAIADHGIVYAQKGIVRLTERNELPEKINFHDASVWHICQYLTYVMEKKGIDGCAQVLSRTISNRITPAKELAYRLYTIAERKKWTQEAYAYNSLIQSWKEIQEKAAKLSSSDSGEQLTL